MKLYHYVLSIMFTVSVLAGLAVASEGQDKKPATAALRLSVTG